MDGSRSKQRQGRHRRYKLPRLTATMTCQEAFRAIARGCLDDLAANQQATCEGDREALHQMRIALTRLRAARSFFSSSIPSPEWSPLKGELKWLNKRLSRARDLDVALKRLPSSDDTRLQAQSLGRAWRKAWSTSHRELSCALHSRRYRILLRDMSIWIENGNRSQDSLQSSTSLTTYSDRQLDRWHKKLIKKSRALEDMNASQRHRLRIRSKRLRYALEILGQLLPSQSHASVREYLKSLRKTQKYLGQLNDAEQGRVIATTLAKPTRDDGAGWRSLFPTDRKARERMIKAAAVTFRKMAELKPF
ncbi:CHAD domain-containing protein [Nitrobacter hamburgensis]|uniref:CHAD domain-containing protein n=1 Tax=Nitrobacter hamburgensis TaxID=912 RepID=UPI001FDA6CEB|nr:CHAD domain-containing protein [Nitrobacter hamburgensis]